MNMKKKMIVASGVMTCIIAFNLFNLFQARRDNPRLNSESSNFVDRFIPKLAHSWDPNESRDFFVPEIADSLEKAPIKATFEYLGKALGPIKEYYGSKGEAGIHLSVWGKKRIVAEYIGSARFENGFGIVKVSLRMEGESWKVSAFNATLTSTNNENPRIQFDNNSDLKPPKN